MPFGSLVDAMSPHARVATALIPFLLAIVLRLVFGKSRVTRGSLSLATLWFAINVLLAPYSAELRSEILSFGARFR
jgi:hypothetical protein